MKHVLVAGALSGLLILGTPALAFSADRGGSRDSHSGNSGHSDNRGGHADNRGGHADNRGDRGDRARHDNDRYRDGGYYYGDPYYYGDYQECHRDPSGSVTCEPYGGDYDPGGYNGGYPDPPPDQQYCSQPHSAHSARCPGDAKSSGGY